MNTSKILILLVLVLLLSAPGCVQFGAQVKKSSADINQRAMAFSPPSNKVGIYIMRPKQFVAAGSAVPVFLDHDRFGSLPPGSFLYCEPLAREHVLELAEMPGAVSTSLRFKTEAGRCYFFYSKVVLGGFHLEVVSEEEGKERLRKYKLSGDNVFESKAGEPEPNSNSNAK